MHPAFRRISVLCAAVLLAGLRGPAPHAAAQAASGITATARVYIPIATRPPTAQSVEQQVIDLTNQARRDNGCNVDLTLSSKLAAAAARHSSDMAVNNIFSHTGSDGSTMQMRVEAAGYSYGWLAENIAAGYTTPQAVVASWMASSGHRKNILNCNLREIGVGYYYQAGDQNNVRDDSGHIGGPYYYYWTQDFGTPPG